MTGILVPSTSQSSPISFSYANNGWQTSQLVLKPLRIDEPAELLFLRATCVKMEPQVVTSLGAGTEPSSHPVVHYRQSLTLRWTDCQTSPWKALVRDMKIEIQKNQGNWKMSPSATILQWFSASTMSYCTLYDWFLSEVGSSLPIGPDHQYFPRMNYDKKQVLSDLVVDTIWTQWSNLEFKLQLNLVLRGPSAPAYTVNTESVIIHFIVGCFDANPTTVEQVTNPVHPNAIKFENNRLQIAFPESDEAVQLPLSSLITFKLPFAWCRVEQFKSFSDTALTQMTTAQSPITLAANPTEANSITNSQPTLLFTVNSRFTSPTSVFV